MNDENWLEKCLTCQHCYIPQNEDDEIRCRRRLPFCEYKPHKTKKKRKPKDVNE